MATTEHFKVRSVLLSGGGAAVTLDPVEWINGEVTEDEEVVDGDWYLDPMDERAEPYESGGKCTELRFDEDPGYRPNEYVTVKIDRTHYLWKPKT